MIDDVQPYDVLPREVHLPTMCFGECHVLCVDGRDGRDGTRYREQGAHGNKACKACRLDESAGAKVVESGLLRDRRACSALPLLPLPTLHHLDRFLSHLPYLCFSYTAHTRRHRQRLLSPHFFQRFSDAAP